MSSTSLCYGRPQFSRAVHFSVSATQRLATRLIVPIAPSRWNVLAEKCWCGEAGIDYSRHGTATCDFPCSGDPSTMCGGDLAFTLYALEEHGSPGSSPISAPTFEYIGCFNDSKGDRILSGFTSSSSMTPQVTHEILLRHSIGMILKLTMTC